jgi:hypothetical protein
MTPRSPLKVNLRLGGTYHRRTFFAACFMLVYFVVYTLTPNKEVIYSSEASASLYELRGVISQTIEFVFNNHPEL